MSASVLPTHVGMSLLYDWLRDAGVSAPHTRGDEPALKVLKDVIMLCSPHTWG